MNPLDLVAAFAGLRVLVIEEAILDSYRYGRAKGLCREAPVPMVTLSDDADVPGGAANTAVNVRSLGGRVSFLSVMGCDAEGARLRRLLSARGVQTDAILEQPSRRTLNKVRVFADGQMVVRLDGGSAEPLDPEAERWLLRALEALAPRADALIVSDYDYGLMTPHPLVVDAKHPERYREAKVTAVKPNYEEAARLLNLGACAGSRADAIARYAGRLLERTGARSAAVTLDADGAVIVARGAPPYRTYARPLP